MCYLLFSKNKFLQPFLRISTDYKERHENITPQNGWKQNGWEQEGKCGERNLGWEAWLSSYFFPGLILIHWFLG